MQLGYRSLRVSVADDGEGEALSRHNPRLPYQ
jgi:hypothetical protein